MYNCCIDCVPVSCEKIMLRLIGGLIMIVSPITCGLGIADVILTYNKCRDDDPCHTLTMALVMTWIATGIWASIPVNTTCSSYVWRRGIEMACRTHYLAIPGSNHITTLGPVSVSREFTFNCTRSTMPAHPLM